MDTILFSKVLRVKRNHLNFHSDSVWCILNEILKHCCHVLSLWRCKTQKYKVFPQTCIIFCVRNFLLITFCTLHKHVSLKLAQYHYMVYLIHNVKMKWLLHKSLLTTHEEVMLCRISSYASYFLWSLLSL